ncbi:hypothetical protein [Sphingomonas panni]|nr:hypothetical protein [Sphingomonas panni]
MLGGRFLLEAIGDDGPASRPLIASPRAELAIVPAPPDPVVLERPILQR